MTDKPVTTQNDNLFEEIRLALLDPKIMRGDLVQKLDKENWKLNAIQELYDRIDRRREADRSSFGETGEVVGMGYCLDMILAMQRNRP